jgi:hypothetical protein
MLVTFGKNKRLVVGSLVGMFAIAVILSGSFLFLLSTGYATSVDSIKSLVALRNRGALKTASSKLAARYPAMNFPEMPLESIDNELSPGRLDTVSTERLWHTFFTRLYRVDRKPALIWYPGGDVLTASKQLEIRGVD